jgi:hypothetical protein
MHPLSLGKEHPQSRPEAGSRKELDGGSQGGHKARLPSPADFGDGARRAAFSAIKDAIRPTLSAGVFRVGAKYIARGFQDALRQRLAVMRQE